jgi:hypothetical protein
MSKIEQLEERQNITAKYAVGVKRQLEKVQKELENLHQFIQQNLIPEQQESLLDKILWLLEYILVIKEILNRQGFQVFDEAFDEVFDVFGLQLTHQSFSLINTGLMCQ